MPENPEHAEENRYAQDPFYPWLEGDEESEVPVANMTREQIAEAVRKSGEYIGKKPKESETQ